MPFLRHLEIRYPGGLAHDIVTCATPIDDRSVMLNQWCWRSDTEAGLTVSVGNAPVTLNACWALTVTEPMVATVAATLMAGSCT